VKDAKKRTLILTKQFNAFPKKIPASYFVDTDKLILRLIWECKKNPE